MRQAGIYFYSFPIDIYTMVRLNRTCTVEHNVESIYHKTTTDHALPVAKSVLNEPKVIVIRNIQCYHKTRLFLQTTNIKDLFSIINIRTAMPMALDISLFIFLKTIFRCINLLARRDFDVLILFLKNNK